MTNDDSSFALSNYYFLLYKKAFVAYLHIVKKFGLYLYLYGKYKYKYKPNFIIINIQES